MWRKIRLLLIISGLIAAINANAQFDDPKTLEVGPHVGASYYMGDINPAKPFAMSDLQYGGVVRFNYNNRWTFRFDYSRVKVKADDKVIGWRPERGLNFFAKINDFSLVAEFNFLEYYTGNPKKNVSPYIFGGVSMFTYTPYCNVQDSIVDLRKYITEEEVSASPIGLSIPFGFGVKFSLSRHMAASVEWRMQKTFVDYLDGVATVYPKDASYYGYEEHLVDKQGNPIVVDKQGKLIVVDNQGNPIVDNQGNPIKFDVDTQNSYAMIYNLSDPTATPLQASVNSKGETVFPGQMPDGHYNYKANQQRGNSAFNDWFGMARVSLTWKFNLPDGRGCNLSKF